RIIARQVPCTRVRIIARKFSSEKKMDSVSVQVGLVVRAAPVNAIKIEPGRAKVDEGIRVILLLKTAIRVEREVMVDKLAEVGIPSRNVGILFGIPIGIRSLFFLGFSSHGLRELPQHLKVVNCWRECPENATEPPLEEDRSRRKEFSPQLPAVATPLHLRKLN